MVQTAIQLPEDRIAEFCKKWRVREFSLFGSILRPDFRPDSDVDVLVDLEPQVPWTLFEWVEMIDELKVIFGRNVDLVDKSAINNPFRKRTILASRRIVYAA